VKSIYIVLYYESFEENNYLNIVMEYCDGGDLSHFIEKNKETGKFLEENLVWNIFIKITIGLAALHKSKILHRDLK
jgi:NIMA (never in mitosis gene a)-related kinase